MTNQNTERSGNYGTGGETRGAGGTENLNWGSARSDYGEHAYGGRLDEKGLERGARSDYDSGMESGYRRRRKFFRGSDKSNWANRGLMLLGGTVVGVGVGVGIGVGVGLAAMYLFDPEQGKTRRETARGKITDATHKAGDFINRKTGDLRERAGTFMASARRESNGEKGAVKITSGANAMTASEGATTNRVG